MAQQAIDLVGGLVGLFANPAVSRNPGASRRSHCNCGCHEPAPCRHAGRLQATTDIKLETQLGERRIISLLVENNRPRESTVTFRAGPWLNAHGQATAIPVEFTPASATLKPGETVGVRAAITLAEPLEADMAYYSEIIIEGCSVRPITICVLVQSRNCGARYVLCDECRPARGRFVEYCCDCGCESACGCGDCHPCDPHRHWFDPCACAAYYRAP